MCMKRGKKKLNGLFQHEGLTPEFTEQSVCDPNLLPNRKILLRNVRTYLRFFKRFLDLLPGRKMSDVAADLLGSCTKTCDSVGYNQVDFACICLCGDVVTGSKSGFLAEELIESVTFGGIATKDLQERGLCSSRSLGTTEFEVFSNVLNALEVKHQVLGPLSCSLSHSDPAL